MVALPNDCPPLDGIGACAPLPLAFVRLRYFFGKRLGVADFVDQQLYHAAKMRFHNQHAHGAGVLCGLKLSLFGGSNSVVRVARGAAIDRCGREIIVGVDQCIDINAWIARQVKDDPNWATKNVKNGHVTLCAVLRYAECTTSPEPAPRDPCSCEDGGCEFGRIREGFELDLRTEAQAEEFIAPVYFPDGDALTAVAAGSISRPSFDQGLANKVGAQPPNPAGEEWLIVNCFDIAVKKDSNDAWVVDESALAPLTFLPASAPLLLETGVLQELLLRTIAADYQPGALLGNAPQIAGVTMGAIHLTDDVDFTLILTGDIFDKTVDPADFVLNYLNPTTGWEQVGDGSGNTIAFTAASGTTPASLKVPLNNNGKLQNAGAGATRAYRLTIAQNDATPIVDTKMRPLLPLHFSWDFLVDENGAVVAGGPFV